MIDFVSSQVYGLGGFESQVFFCFLGGVVAFASRVSQVYRVSGGVMLKHRITLGLRAVIVLD